MGALRALNGRVAMPQLVLIALAGAGLIAGYQWVKHQIEAENARTERPENAGETMRDLGTLAWDEASGAYRPVRRE